MTRKPAGFLPGLDLTGTLTFRPAVPNPQVYPVNVPPAQSAALPVAPHPVAAPPVAAPPVAAPLVAAPPVVVPPVAAPQVPAQGGWRNGGGDGGGGGGGGAGGGGGGAGGGQGGGGRGHGRGGRGGGGRRGLVGQGAGGGHTRDNDQFPPGQDKNRARRHQVHAAIRGIRKMGNRDVRMILEGSDQPLVAGGIPYGSKTWKRHLNVCLKPHLIAEEDLLKLIGKSYSEFFEWVDVHIRPFIRAGRR